MAHYNFAELYSGDMELICLMEDGDTIRTLTKSLNNLVSNVIVRVRKLEKMGLIMVLKGDEQYLDLTLSEDHKIRKNGLQLHLTKKGNKVKSLLIELKRVMA